MTKTTVALNAFRGIIAQGQDAGMHIELMETMRTLKLTTDEAVELRTLVSQDWTQVVQKHDYQGAECDRWSLAKTVVNQYARDYRLH